MKSITTYRWKNKKKIIPIDSTDEKPSEYPFLKIQTLTDDDNIVQIKGTYSITRKNDIKCIIYGDQLSGLVKAVKGHGQTLNAKLNYIYRGNQ